MTQTGASTVFALLSARWLEPGDRGVVVLVMVAVTMYTLVGTLGFPVSSRLLLVSSPAELTTRRFVAMSRRLMVAQAPTAAIVAVGVLATADRSSVPLFVQVVGILVLSGFSYCIRAGVHGKGAHVAAVVGGELLAAVVQLGGLFVLSLTSVITLEKVIWLLLGVALLQTLVLSRVMRRFRSADDEVLDDSNKTLGRLVVRGIPAAATNLAEACVLRADRMILGIFATTSAVGIYSVAATLAEVAGLVALALGNVAFRLASLGRWESARTVYRQVIATSAVLAALVAGTAHLVIVPLFGESYEQAVEITYVFAVTSVLMASARMDVATLNGTGALRLAAGTMATGAITLVALGMALVPLFGMAGAAAASLSANALMAIMGRLAVNGVASRAPSARGR
jgi:O-antigen/teichoic acid export membrane protein